MKHLDTSITIQHSRFTSGFEYEPDKKYTLSAFSQTQITVLSRTCSRMYPSHVGIGTLELPCAYHEMQSVTVNGQKFCSDQYVSARSMFSFPSSSSGTHTVFSDPSLRPAKVHHFATHSFQTSDYTQITHGFAVVSWPMPHPLKLKLGKPYEVWCSSLFESTTDNCILPLENIHSLLLSCKVSGGWGSLCTWVCTVYLNVCSCLVRFLLLSQILFYLNLSWMFLLRFRVYISNCILVVLTMFQYLFPQWVLVLRYAL